MAPKFHPLDVTHVRSLTTDAVAVTFAVPSTLFEDYVFQPGQYLTLRATIDGVDERRSYSICSAASRSETGDSFLEVGIKHVPDGVFSSYAQTLEVGQTLQVMTPQGRFVIEPVESQNVLLIAAGSGITPCLSMLKSLLQSDADSHATLLYGNRSLDTIMFRDDLAALKDQYTERLSLLHVLSRERQDATVLNGRIDAAKIRTLHKAGLINSLAAKGIYCCGPQAMIDSVTDALQGLGTPLERVHTELFTTLDNASARQVSSPSLQSQQQTTAAEVTGAAVKIIFDGSERTIQVDAAAETVLQAATRSGLDLPFSCQGGMCCTCRCKVASGEVAMDVNFSLAQWEIDAGFTLACQARPVSDSLVLDFDAT